MSDTIRETADDVAALIPQYSWQLMDEDQRDALMKGVVVKRYMKTTKDGVQLGPKWWAALLGAEAEAIRKRVGRIQAADQGKHASASAPAPNQVASIRSAKAAIRAHPDLAKQLYDDPKVKDAVDRAVLSGSGQTHPKGRPDPYHAQQRDIDLGVLMNNVCLAIERAMRALPDYVPDADFRDQAQMDAVLAEGYAAFLRSWAKGKDITDDIESFLAEQ